jgi:hypothetical protein
VSKAGKTVDFAPVRGTPPVLTWAAPADLRIDAGYQRALDGGSEVLIARIAAAWDWGLCQPLNVSRRADGRLFVVDGQHRLQAAMRRGDIAHLPCVVVDLASTADEAACFVALNGQRRALSPLEMFRGQVASGAQPETQIFAAMQRAGLSLAPHTNFRQWKPGMVANVAGLRSVWKNRGPEVSEQAMTLLARAWPGEVIRYAGAMYDGLAALCAAPRVAAELADPARAEGIMAELLAVVGAVPQMQWYHRIARVRFDSELAGPAAAAHVFGEAWRARGGMGTAPSALSTPRHAPAPDRFDRASKGGAQFCTQCDKLRDAPDVAACGSPFCKLRGAA